MEDPRRPAEAQVCDEAKVADIVLRILAEERQRQPVLGAQRRPRAGKAGRSGELRQRPGISSYDFCTLAKALGTRLMAAATIAGVALSIVHRPSGASRIHRAQVNRGAY
jgi:hypothetical protein